MVEINITVSSAYVVPVVRLYLSTSVIVRFSALRPAFAQMFSVVDFAVSLEAF
jgi:hypothetical protein